MRLSVCLSHYSVVDILSIHGSRIILILLKSNAVHFCEPLPSITAAINTAVSQAVLTATHHSYGSRRLSDFFSISALGVRPLNGYSRKMAQTTCFHARMCLLQQNSLLFIPPNLAFNIRGHRGNTPYSSSEPNESGIVNRQSGGEKLKYILQFYIKGTCHVIRACAMTI